MSNIAGGAASTDADEAQAQAFLFIMGLTGAPAKTKLVLSGPAIKVGHTDQTREVRQALKLSRSADETRRLASRFAEAASGSVYDQLALSEAVLAGEVRYPEALGLGLSSYLLMFADRARLEDYLALQILSSKAKGSLSREWLGSLHPKALENALYALEYVHLNHGSVLKDFPRVTALTSELFGSAPSDHCGKGQALKYPSRYLELSL